MGSTVSLELVAPLDYFNDWDLPTSVRLLKAYKQNDYDFGLSSSTVVKLLAEVKENPPSSIGDEIIQMFSRGRTGLINALSLITGIIFFSVPSSSSSGIEEKSGVLFDAFDFDDCGEISYDELTILLFSMLRAVTVMTGMMKSPLMEPSDEQLEELSNQIYEAAGKNPEDELKRTEFVEWAKKKVGHTMSAVEILGEAALVDADEVAEKLKLLKTANPDPAEELTFGLEGGDAGDQCAPPDWLVPESAENGDQCLPSSYAIIDDKDSLLEVASQGPVSFASHRTASQTSLTVEDFLFSDIDVGPLTIRVSSKPVLEVPLHMQLSDAEARTVRSASISLVDQIIGTSLSKIQSKESVGLPLDPVMQRWLASMRPWWAKFSKLGKEMPNITVKKVPCSSAWSGWGSISAHKTTPYIPVLNKRVLMKHEVKPGVRVLWSSPACLEAPIYGTIKHPASNPDSFFVNWTTGRCTRVERQEVWFASPGKPILAKRHPRREEIKAGLRVFWYAPTYLGGLGFCGTVSPCCNDPDSFIVSWVNGRATRTSREEVWLLSPQSMEAPKRTLRRPKQAAKVQVKVAQIPVITHQPLSLKNPRREDVKQGMRVQWAAPACLGMSRVFGTISKSCSDPDSFTVFWVGRRPTRVSRQDVWLTTSSHAQGGAWCGWTAHPKKKPVKTLKRSQSKKTNAACKTPVQRHPMRDEVKPGVLVQWSASRMLGGAKLFGTIGHKCADPDSFIVHWVGKRPTRVSREDTWLVSASEIEAHTYDWTSQAKKRHPLKWEVKQGVRVQWIAPRYLGGAALLGSIGSRCADPDSFIVYWVGGRPTRVSREDVWLAPVHEAEAHQWCGWTARPSPPMKVRKKTGRKKAARRASAAFVGQAISASLQNLLNPAFTSKPSPANVLAPGAFVVSKFMGVEQRFGLVVKAHPEGTFDVLYDNGAKEVKVSAKQMRLKVSSQMMNAEDEQVFLGLSTSYIKDQAILHLINKCA